MLHFILYWQWSHLDVAIPIHWPIQVLRGLERVLRLFYSRLLLTLTRESDELWFPQIWKEILRVSFDSAILTGEGETLDMRLAGIELMVLCAQLSCRAGIGAAVTSARVGTNMEVVGGAGLPLIPRTQPETIHVEGDTKA